MWYVLYVDWSFFLETKSGADGKGVVGGEAVTRYTSALLSAQRCVRSPPALCHDGETELPLPNRPPRVTAAPL